MECQRGPDWKAEIPQDGKVAKSWLLKVLQFEGIKVVHQFVEIIPRASLFFALTFG